MEKGGGNGRASGDGKRTEVEGKGRIMKGEKETEEGGEKKMRELGGKEERERLL